MDGSDPVLTDRPQAPPAQPAQRVKVLLAKTGLDGHWRGISVVSLALRNAGFEVILGGMLTADQIAATALHEDVHLIGLNVGGRAEVVARIVKAVLDAGLEHVPIIAGGSISPQAQKRLADMGITSFPPGSALTDIVAAARSLTANAAPRSNVA